MQTKNGRPAKLGSMYIDDSRGYRAWAYCVGYCPNCQEKIGMSSDDMNEFVYNMPGFFMKLLKNISRIRLDFPRR